MEQLATLPLDRLLTRAPSPDPHFADAVSRALVDAPAQGERLVELLNSGKLRGMIGTDGTVCETLVARRVLELGYPWALHLTPKQLEAVRELKPARKGVGYGAFLASAGAFGLDIFPLFFSWLELISEPTIKFFGLFALLSGAAAAVNLFFVTGKLSRGHTGLLSVIALMLCWFAFTLTRSVDAMSWGWLAIVWMLTLVATRAAPPTARSGDLR
jgi:hypothetical protein